VLSVSPTSLTFPSQQVGTTSAVQYVNLTNTGNATLTFGTSTVSGDFAFAGVGSCTSTLSVGGSCTFSIKFTPTASGTRTGTLTINSNASNSPQLVSLTGTGVSPSPTPTPTPTPSYAYSQSSYYAYSQSSYYAYSQSAYTSGKDYYVSPTGNDANSGSAASPWKTIQHAASVVTVGYTVHVAPGTYTEQVTISNSGTASSHIRFISDTKWAALMRGTSVCRGAFFVAGSYVDIIGFDISNGAYTCTEVVGIMLGTWDRALGNKIHDLPVECSSQGGAAVGTHANGYTDHDNEVSGNVIDNIQVASTCTDHSHAQGIYFAVPNGKAFNNVVSNVTANCVSSWHAATNLTVSGNTIMNCGGAGVSIGADGSAGNDANSIVSDNIVRNSPYGFAENGAVSGTRFINNLVFSDATNFKLLSGSQTGTVSGDPLNINYTGSAVTGDYHLQSTSPAKDAGTSTGAPTKDIEGGSRPINALYDIGAYEYGSTPPTWPWY
jgi:Abnormal spindle-like microcephaly-assoc'd, ASPM-SPD-2-Hydin/Protein of unknown function (DUF1565)